MTFRTIRLAFLLFAILAPRHTWAEDAALILTGSGTPEVQLLEIPKRPAGEGTDPGVDAVREVLSTKQREKAESWGRTLFSQARWDLRPDGSFRFSPGPEADARDDLFPLEGHYVRGSEGIELRAWRQAPLGASVSLDGILRETSGSYHLDAVYAVVSGPSRRIALVHQDLVPGEPPPASEVRVGGVPVPSMFDVTLTGRSGTTDLPTVSATLEIGKAVAGASAPLSVSIEGSDVLAPGAVLWLSLPPASTGGPAAYHVTADKGRISIQVTAPPGDVLAPSWVAPAGHPALGGIPFPHAAEEASLELAVRGDEVTGRIRATGRLLTDPKGKTEVYEGSLSGRRRAADAPPPPATEAAPFDWNFEISFAGSTDAGPFEGHKGTLFLVRQGVDGYALTLGTTGEARNGWIAWLDTSTPAIKEDEPITLFYESEVPDAESLLTWWTGSPAETPDIAVPRKLSLTFRIRDGAVEGEIHGEGVKLTPELSPSTYRAFFRGRVRESDTAEKLRSEISEVDLDGEWIVEDGTGGARGSLSLVRENGELRGVYEIGGTSYRLSGSINSGRADLSATGTGELRMFLRAVAGGEALVGLRTDRREAPLPLVARRSPASRLTDRSEAESLIDADALRYLGTDLMLQGRFEAARDALERSLAIYQREMEKTTGLLLQVIGASIHGAVQRLITCDVQLTDLEGLVGHLRQGLQMLRPFRPGEIARREIYNEAAELYAELRQNQERLRVFRGHFRQLRGEAAAVANATDACETALAPVEEALAKQIAELEQLASEVAADRFPLNRAQGLTSWIPDLQRQVRSAHGVVALAGKEVLERSPQIRQQRDLLWESFKPVPSGRIVNEALAIQEATFLTDLRESRLTDAEKELVFQQYKTGVTLLSLDRMLSFSEQPSVALDGLMASAVQTIREMAQWPDPWREKALTDPEKIEALRQLESFFADLVILLLEEGRPLEALEVSEIARSRAFVDLLAGREEIRRDLDQILAQTGGRTIPSPTAAAPLSREELLAITRRRGGTTVEYFVTRDQLAIWAISPAGQVTAISQKMDREDLSGTIRDLRELLGGPSPPTIGPCPSGEPALLPPGREEREKTAGLLRRLYELLIAPVARENLLPVDPDEMVTLIPHGELFGVPFAALEDGSGRPLIAAHTLVFSPSIAVLRYTHENRERAAALEPRLLAMVNPSPMRDERRCELPSLNALESRFSLIADFFPATGRRVLNGATATEKALFEEAPGATVLELATHAKFLRDDPLGSFIALAAAGEPEKAYLRVSEVFRLNLAAELVILWACETGLGRVTADGVEGLSRAFTWAGAPSLLLSLWPISEEESFRQLYGFHFYWREQGMPKAQALRRAQIEYRQLYPDQPGLWAGLVLYGEGD